MTRNATTAAVILITAAAAFAMTELDSNGDNMLTLQEVQAAYPEVTEDAFVGADTDADGLLNEDELAEARAAGVIPGDQG